MSGLGNIKEHFIVARVADDTIANSVALADDDTLLYPIFASEKVFFQVYILYTALAGGIRVAMSGPAGSTDLHYLVCLDVTGTTVSNSALGTAWDTYAALAGASTGLIRITGHLENGATPGNLVFRFAQSTSNANVTTIHRGGTLLVSRY